MPPRKQDAGKAKMKRNIYIAMDPEMWVMLRIEATENHVLLSDHVGKILEGHVRKSVAEAK